MGLWQRTLTDPIYDAQITLLVGPLEELRRWRSRHERREVDLGGYANAKTIQCDYETFSEWYVWFPAKPSLATLAHEAIHVVLQVLRVRGLEPCRQNEEAFAYYFAYVFGELSRALLRCRRRTA